jgi:hypothetical protein
VPVALEAAAHLVVFVAVVAEEVHELGEEAVRAALAPKIRAALHLDHHHHIERPRNQP